MCTKPDEARTLKEIEGVETMVEGGVDARDAVGSLGIIGIARLAVETTSSIQIPSEDPNLSDEERQKLDELHANADGFTPDFTDTYKKADIGHEECSCQSVASSVPSSSVVQWNKQVGQVSAAPR